MPNSGWSGFFPKAALGAFGILFTLLVGYFVWLGTAVIEVREKAIIIEARLVNIEDGVNSLDESRRRRIDARIEQNRQRIGELDNGNGE